MLSHTALALYFGYDPRRTWLMKADMHCQRALQLDPELAEAIMAKGMILWSPSRNFQHAEALACLEKALQLQPNLDHAWNRAGTICTHVGRIPEAAPPSPRGSGANLAVAGFVVGTLSDQSLPSSHGS
jgi:tetratricopeptide (TPR) repeat protein